MRVSKKFLITEQVVIDFSKISNDHNPIHLDEQYAKNTIFEKRVAHGMLLASYISGLIANDFPGEGSIYLEQNLSFKKPCFIGDEIEVIVDLIEKNKNKYKLSTTVKSGENILITGEALILKK
jgi:3-hydroxybutyryl-CoA dehydratase